VNVVITGAASGLGLSIAEHFAAQGHQAFVCDASEQSIAALARRRIVTLASTVDVSKREQIERWLRGILEQVGHVDVLVNNVGVAGPHAAVENVAPEEWRATLAANLDAALFTSQLVLPAMKSARAGSIINVSTASVVTSPANRVPYVVSKAALEALTGSIAREAGPYGVRCNAVRPGMIDNERSKRVLQRVADQSGRKLEEVEAEQLRYIWMARKIPMPEIAALVLFLASDAARSITGQIIAVDGGMRWEE
jgi:NAD(P)-dependent dehydrogenase (short-subunit alcohol dehydrogenase family)